VTDNICCEQLLIVTFTSSCYSALTVQLKQMSLSVLGVIALLRFAYPLHGMQTSEVGSATVLTLCVHFVN